MTPSLKEKIQQEARTARKEYVKEEKQIGTPADSAKWAGIGFLDGYEAGATAILTNPAAYGLGPTPLINALNKIITMNRQQAADQYGDAEKAETRSCVKVAREALEQYSIQVGK